MPKQWHISQLALSAFKSFAETTTLEVPSHQLVGITGPNGCGKSNLLEALCFAAGCPASDLRSSLLKDCQSSDESAQLCRVQLVVSNGVQQHALVTSLTPDGSRSYKLDGKLRTGTQVKEFLRSKGITIDANTVIRQATVTQLADSNDGDRLSKVVANASGLARWREQASLAAAEVQRTQQALQHITASIQQLQAAIGGDTACLQALQQAQALRRELLGVVQQLAQALAAQQGQMQLLAQEAGLAEAALKEELQERQLQLANQQQAVDESAMQATAAAAALQEVVSSVQQLQQQLLLAEHGCQLLQKEAEAAVHQQQQLQHQAQRMSSLQQQQELVQQQLAAAQQDVARLQALLDSAAQAGSMAEQQARQVQLLQQQAVEAAAAVQQQQEQESQDQQQLQLAEQHLAGLQQQMQQLADAAGVTCEELLQSGAHTAASKTSSSSSKGALEALQRSAQQYQQQLLAADVKVSQLQAQLSSRVVQTLQRMLPTSSSRPSSRAPVTNSSRSGVGSSAGRSLDTPGGSERADMCCVMDAFTVRNAADPQVQQLAPALAAVCGISTLGVVLVEGSVQVQQVLSALQAAGSSWRHGKVRLWPLDQLQARDLTHKQRAAQAGLGASKVFLPLDMLEFGPKYQPAMQRAFGGYVIAVDDATAAEVVNKYGLSCVTLQGTVSHKGSMSGGWSGPQANPALQRWQQKLQLDAASQLRQELQGSLLTLQLQIEQEEVQQAQQQEVAALCMQVEDGEARRAAAATQHAAAVMLLQQLQQQAEHCQVRLHQQQQQEQKPGGDWHAGGGRSAAEAHQELQEQHAAAAAKAAALETQLESLAEQADELSAAMEAAGLQAPSTAPQQLQEQQQQLAQLQASLLAAQQQQEEQAAAAQQLQQQQAHQQQQLRSVKHKVAALEQQLLERREAAAAAAAGAGAASARLQELHHEFSHLQPLLGGPAAGAAGVDRGSSTATGSSAGNSASPAGQQATKAATPAVQQADSKEVGRLEQQLRRLQRQLEAEGREEVSSADQVLAQQRLQQLTHLQDQAAALTAAAAALQRHMSAAEAAVAAAHQGVLLEVAEGFQQLCGSLLPSLEVELVAGAGGTGAAGGGGGGRREAGGGGGVGGDGQNAGGAGKEPTAAAAAGGLQLRFRLRSGVQDASPDAPSTTTTTTTTTSSSSGWQSSLQQLSGGQRTLVSLAFLLATGRAGCSSRLLLLDEVDAALDEHNQRRVAELLRQLANGSSGCEETGPGCRAQGGKAKRKLGSSSTAGDGASCQILCISHNAPFQSTCHALLPVSSRAGRKAAASAAMAGPSAPVEGSSAPGKKAVSRAAGRKGAKQGGVLQGSAAASKPRRGQKRVTFAELSDVD